LLKTIDTEFANHPLKPRTDTEKAFAGVVREANGNIEFSDLTVGGVVFFTLLLVTGNTMAIAVRERIGEIGCVESPGIFQPICAPAGDDGITDCRLIGGGLDCCSRNCLACVATPRAEFCRTFICRRWQL